MSSERSSLNFFAGFFGLIFEPGNTPHSLLRGGKYPRHGASYLFLFILTLLGPLIWFTVSRPALDLSRQITGAVGALALVTFVGFILAVGFALTLLAVRFRLIELISIVCYCLVPFTIALWVLMALHYAFSGSPQFVFAVLSAEPLAPTLVTVFPYIFWVMHVYMALVFHFSLVALDELHPLSSLIVSIGALVVYGVVLTLSLQVADLVRPGVSHIIRSLAILAGLPESFAR